MMRPDAVATGFRLPAGLTQAQVDAVTAPDQVLCVLAGAGAGKTRVLTLRVARRVHDGSVAPHRALVCTFSRKAADELNRRLWMLGVADGVRTGTFHRTALGILRQYRVDRGLAPPVLLTDRRRFLAEMLGDQFSRSGRSGPHAGQVEGEIGWAKARLVAPDAFEDSARQAERRPAGGLARIADIYTRYEDERRRRGLLDLDDLLWDAADVLADDRGFAAAVRWRNRHLFVDEMQDVNPAQFRLLRLLLGDEPDICVVGDPRQSIYGWNGADPSLLDRLPALVPGVKVVRLDENHRCSPQVVTVATAALRTGDADLEPPRRGGKGAGGLTAEPDGPVSTRPDGPTPRFAEFPDDAAEAAWVAREVWRAHRPGRKWAQIAVLARTNVQLGPLADALRREHVPFVLAGGDLGPASDVTRAGDDDGDREGDAVHAGGNGESDESGETDGIVLTTFHRAKGLQWAAVFVVGLSEGLVPIRSARTATALAEERRLLYVALTRAEDELTCTWARFADAEDDTDARAGHRAAPRRASRWWSSMLEARDALDAARSPADPATVARRIADLRARLAADRVTLG
jgi:DNA helicase-2/ATP-dependent DNA helicase PcrA